MTINVTVYVNEVIQPHFGGVGFHVFHHVFPITKSHLEMVVAKRWRELNPSFARMNHCWDWDEEMLDQVASHILRLKNETRTEIYMATWGPKVTQPGEERAEYACRVVDTLEYLIRSKGCSNIRYYCMSNELTLERWGSLIHDLSTFRDYHRHLFEELRRRGLAIQLLATDASPIQNWWTIEWAAENMDDITGIYGGHHYINHPLDDEQFYPWFLSKLGWMVQVARRRGKGFILGEFGPKPDGRVINGVKRDTCIYWDTPQEPWVGIQMAEAVIAGLNAGVYAMAYWTFMDFPDDYRRDYINKWGLFKWSGNDFSTRAHYYAYGLLTKFFRGPATVFRVETDDPYLRAAAVQHHEGATWSLAIVNRYRDDVSMALTIMGEPLNAEFRKYIYDPRHVPYHPFGDLPPPVEKVTMWEGRLQDTVPRGGLVVYTTAYDDEPPSPVRDLHLERKADGKVHLTWRPNPESDLCYYRVHRSSEPNFVPSVENQIGSTVATEFWDLRPPESESFYRVVAVDRSGNASR